MRRGGVSALLRLASAARGASSLALPLSVQTSIATRGSGGRSSTSGIRAWPRRKRACITHSASRGVFNPKNTRGVRLWLDRLSGPLRGERARPRRRAAGAPHPLRGQRAAALARDGRPRPNRLLRRAPRPDQERRRHQARARRRRRAHSEGRWLLRARWSVAPSITRTPHAHTTPPPGPR